MSPAEAVGAASSAAARGDFSAVRSIAARVNHPGWAAWLNACADAAEGKELSAAASLAAAVVADPGERTEGLLDALDAADAAWLTRAAPAFHAFLKRALREPGFLPFLAGGPAAAEMRLAREAAGASEPPALSAAGASPGKSEAPSDGRTLLVADGLCFYYSRRAREIQALDKDRRVGLVAFQELGDEGLRRLLPGASARVCREQLHAVDPGGRVYGGFAALRRLAWDLPDLRSLIPAMFFPGTVEFGDWASGLVSRAERSRYDPAAKHDYLCQGGGPAGDPR